MSKVIWKYPLRAGGPWPINMPTGAKVLTAQMQGGVAQLWALVDPDKDPEPRWFRAAGTGHPLPDDAPAWAYIGTIQPGGLVYHVFEVPDGNAD